MSRSAFLLVLALVLPACGEDRTDKRPAFTPYPGGGAAAPANEAIGVAQEIWIAYGAKERSLFPMRPPREREEARRLAEGLRERVRKGEDIGLLAQTESDAPGARAEGFSGVLPRDRAKPDDRDRAVLAVREGEVTPLVDWEGGWWFARRIGLDAARRLEKLLAGLLAQSATAKRYRVRARLIHFHHAEAWPDRHEADAIPESHAIASARATIRDLEGGADFATLANERSWDESGDRGGELLAFDPLGERSPWIMRYDTGYTETLLKILFEAPLGLYRQPIPTKRGVHVVEILERREVTPEELARSRRPAPAQPPKERTPGAR